MRPWTVLDRLQTPEGVLELRQRASDDFLITIDGRVLMNSRAHRSEVGLAELACRGLPGVSAPVVLIGGLGMAYTLRAALECLPADAHVIVAELNPRVLQWCEGPLAPLTSGAVRDPRVEVRIEDVARTIAAAGGGRYAAVVLDLYEGPGGGDLRDHPLYGSAVLRQVRGALAPGGRLAVWSEEPSLPFERNLRAAGFAVARRRLGRGGLRHAVYLATVAVAVPANGRPS
jgi:spermidine synthase